MNFGKVTEWMVICCQYTGFRNIFKDIFLSILLEPSRTRPSDSERYPSGFRISIPLTDGMEIGIQSRIGNAFVRFEKVLPWQKWCVLEIMYRELISVNLFETWLLVNALLVLTGWYVRGCKKYRELYWIGNWHRLLKLSV